MQYVAYLIIFIGALLMLIRPYYYVMYFGLIGSRTGARGFSGYFNGVFPYYSLIMEGLLVLAMLRAIIEYLFRKPVVDDNFIDFSLIYIFFGVISLTCFYFFVDSSGSYPVRVIRLCGSFGPAVMIIYRVYRMKINTRKLLLIYSATQCALAFLIIYGPRCGLSFLSAFNAGVYVSEYWYLDEFNDMVALPGKLLLAFLGKGQYFVRCGQFHNSNGLGFAATVFMLLMILKVIDSVKNKKYKLTAIYGVLSYLGFMLWCNAGTRGPLLAIVIGFALWFVINKMKKKKPDILPMARTEDYRVVFFLVLLMGGMLFLTKTDLGNRVIARYLESGFHRSINGRNRLIATFFSHISDYWLIGYGGNIDGLLNLSIDPHFVSLRVWALYGILPAIIITVILFVLPYREIIAKRNLTPYRVGLLCVVVGIIITNNFTEEVLIWLCLAEAVRISVKPKKDVCDTKIKSVLFVVDDFKGGAFNSCHLICDYLKDKYEINLAVLRKSVETRYSMDGINVFVQTENEKGVKGYIKDIKFIRQCVDKVQPSVVISFLFGVSAWTYLAIRDREDISFICSERSNPSVLKPGFLLKLLVYRAYSRADAVVVLFDEFSNAYPKGIAKKCITIPNQVVKPSKLSTYKGQLKKRIVTCGNSIDYKGYDLIVESVPIILKKNKNFSVHIYGKFNKDTLRQRIDDLGIRQYVSLEDYNPNVYDVLNGAYAYLMTSRVEGFPNALVEGMSIGLLPIVYPCHKGIYDIVDDKSGVLIDENTPKGIANAIIKALRTDEKQYTQKCIAASGVVDKYSFEAVGNKWEKLIEKCLNKEKKANETL